MRTRPLIIAASLLFMIATLGTGQTPRQRPRNTNSTPSRIIIPEPWQHIATGLDSAYYFQPRRVTRPAPGVIRTWIQMALIDQSPEGRDRFIRRNELPTPLYAAYSHTMKLYEFHCGRREVRVLQAIDYDTAGQVIETSPDPRAAWEPAPPESIAEGMLERLCR